MQYLDIQEENFDRNTIVAVVDKRIACVTGVI